MRRSYYKFLKSHQNIDLGAKSRFFFLSFLTCEKTCSWRCCLFLFLFSFLTTDTVICYFFDWCTVIRSEPVLRDRLRAFLPPPAAALPAPPALRLPPRLPGSFSHCWEEQDAATAAGSKLSTSTSLKKKKKKKKFTLTYTDASTSTDSHRLRPDRGSLLGITCQRG